MAVRRPSRLDRVGCNSGKLPSSLAKRDMEEFPWFFCRMLYGRNGKAGTLSFHKSPQSECSGVLLGVLCSCCLVFLVGFNSIWGGAFFKACSEKPLPRLSSSSAREQNSQELILMAPCAQIVHTLALKYSLYKYIGAKVYTIRVHEPLG